jgi:hypothetical protein
MKLSFKVTKIGVHPNKDGKSNVIAEIMWQYIAERNGQTSISIIETMLPINSLNNFTPIEKVTKEKVLEWVIAAEGGQAFLDSLIPHHELNLTYRERRAGVQTYVGPLGFELDAQKNQFLVGDMPVETL